MLWCGTESESFRFISFAQGISSVTYLSSILSVSFFVTRLKKHFLQCYHI